MNINNNFNNHNNMNINNNFINNNMNIMNNMNNMNNQFNFMNMNNMNNFNNQFNFMNNMNNMNNFNNQFNFMNNMNNMNNINNNNPFLNINMMMPLFNKNIFNNNEFGEKSLYQEIMNLDNNNLIIGSSKHIKNNSNNIKSYFYLSLFSFDSLEEISKYEIDVVEIEQNQKSPYYCNFTMKLDKNNISIHINASLFNKDYNFEFKNSEIISK